jgi:prepilin-type N-terminal cleavage/methylation domain-containing protein
MQYGRESGVTLVEMMAVVAIIGLIAAISFPAVGAGLESIRLASATNSIVAFINSGLNRAERRQQGVEITVSIPEHSLTMLSTEPGFSRSISLPEGVTIARVLPPLHAGSEEPVRKFYLFPAGAVPRIGIEIANRRGDRRLVRIDPTTGVPMIERPATGEK